MGFDANFQALGAQIPAVAPSVPAGCHFVLSRQAGHQLLVSGYGPFQGATLPPEYTGKLGQNVTVAQGYQAARLTGINLLLMVREALGSLDRVEHLLEVTGLVNCTPDFIQQPDVINGCSDLLAEIFGASGRHARSAAGSVALAFNCCVEISLSLLIKA